MLDKAELFENYSSNANEEFEEKLDYIGSQEYFFEWARSLNQEDVDEIIRDYDEKKNKNMNDMIGSAVVGGTSATLAFLMSYINIEYKEKRREYAEINKVRTANTEIRYR